MNITLKAVGDSLVLYGIIHLILWSLSKTLRFARLKAIWLHNKYKTEGLGHQSEVILCQEGTCAIL